MLALLPLLIAAQQPYHWNTTFVATSDQGVISYNGEKFKCYITDLTHKQSWTSTGKPIAFIGKDTLRRSNDFDAKNHIHGLAPGSRIVVTASGPLDLDSVFVRLGSSSPGDGCCMEVDGEGFLGQNHRLSCVSTFDAKVPVDTVQFGFTNSPWRTIGDYDPKTETQHGVPMNPKLQWVPWEKGDNPEVYVDLRPGEIFDSTQLRVIARRRDGSSVVPDSFPGFEPTKSFGMYVGLKEGETLSQAKEDVVRYEFQEREYTWVEFKNVRMTLPQASKASSYAARISTPAHHPSPFTHHSDTP